MFFLAIGSVLFSSNLGRWQKGEGNCGVVRLNSRHARDCTDVYSIIYDRQKKGEVGRIVTAYATCVRFGPQVSCTMWRSCIALPLGFPRLLDKSDLVFHRFLAQDQEAFNATTLSTYKEECSDKLRRISQHGLCCNEKNVSLEFPSILCLDQYMVQR